MDSLEEAIAEATKSAHKPITMLRSKVLILGDAKVGKTALTHLFQSGSYPKNYVMTVGVDFCAKVVRLPDTDVEVELYLYDTAGMPIFNQRELGQKHWKNTNLVMIVFDVSKRDSFLSCSKWLEGVRSVEPGKKISGVLVCNKTDLRESGRDEVKEDEARAYARSAGLEYCETSALRSENFSQPFETLAKMFHDKFSEHLKTSEDAPGGF